MAKKYLDETGVQRLWEAIEAKFTDIDELAAALTAAGLEIQALTNEDIDAITGYEEPQQGGNG